MLCLFVTLMFTNSPFIQILYCSLGVLLFGIYIIVDTQLIVGGRSAELEIDDYFLGAMLLYIDIISIFLYILQLLGLTSNNNWWGNDRWFMLHILLKLEYSCNLLLLRDIEYSWRKTITTLACNPFACSSCSQYARLNAWISISRNLRNCTRSWPAHSAGKYLITLHTYAAHIVFVRNASKNTSVKTIKSHVLFVGVNSQQRGTPNPISSSYPWFHSLSEIQSECKIRLTNIRRKPSRILSLLKPKVA